MIALMQHCHPVSLDMSSAVLIIKDAVEVFPLLCRSARIINTLKAVILPQEMNRIVYRLVISKDGGESRFEALSVTVGA